jgi:hypothetical protein
VVYISILCSMVFFFFDFLILRSTALRSWHISVPWLPFMPDHMWSM